MNNNNKNQNIDPNSFISPPIEYGYGYQKCIPFTWKMNFENWSKYRLFSMDLNMEIFSFLTIISLVYLLTYKQAVAFDWCHVIVYNIQIFIFDR